MAHRSSRTSGPRGRYCAEGKRPLAWRWHAGDELVSDALRCKDETAYLVRAETRGDADVDFVVTFARGDAPLRQRCVRPLRAQCPAIADRLAWFETPVKADRMRVHLSRAVAARLVRVDVLQAAERDTKCHPLANVPRWSMSQINAPTGRVVLPRSLAALAERIDWAKARVAADPASITVLRKLVRGAVAILDPAWITALRLTWVEVEALAGDATVVLDLATAARLLSEARLCATDVKTYHDPRDLMSARVDYTAFQTRGFALQDIFPYGYVDAKGRFAIRVLRATRDWKQYADAAAFTTLLTSETPWERRRHDILSASKTTARGQLLITDLPWLVAGTRGPSPAPRVAERMLRAHLGGPVADHAQYWNRWEDGTIIVRDIADFARRYPPLRPVRWQLGKDAVARLGVALVADDAPPTQKTPARETLLIRTGRIDQLDRHDGVPPEPMIIFFKQLAREWREQTAWARRHLSGRTIVWQFDSADGLKYVADYDSAATLGDGPTRVVPVRAGGPSRSGGRVRTGEIVLPADDGLFGDGSFDYQETLVERLIAAIERAGSAHRTTRRAAR